MKKKAAVIGSPISHSKSPLLHNHFLEKEGLSVIYEAIELTSTRELNQFMHNLKGPDWVGVNVTLPYKETVLPYLDHWDDAINTIGACNTIVNKNGQLVGYNTDSAGFYYPLNGQKISSVIILGNGGASKAVLHRCAIENIKNIVLVARNLNKSSEMRDQLAAMHGINILIFSFETLPKEQVSSADLMVNTTSVGMQKTDPIFDCIHWLAPTSIYYDLIYSPKKTKMMAICEKKNIRCMNGGPMLSHQAALAFNHLFNRTIDSNAMLSLLDKNTA